MTYTIIVIDDTRIPADAPDGCELFLYDTPEHGLAALMKLHSEGIEIDELWLDHDMGMDWENGDEITIAPVWEWLEKMGHAGTPLKVNYVAVHTSNPYRASQMVESLTPYYDVCRDKLPTKNER